MLGEHLEKLGYIGTMDESVVCDKDTLAIIVDVSNKERVDNQSFMDCGYIIKIDHHKPFDAPFEDLTWVDTEYSSCSEMILDFYLANSDRLKIEYNGRKALYTGIIGDTGRFAYVDTSSLLNSLILFINKSVDSLLSLPFTPNTSAISAYLSSQVFLLYWITYGKKIALAHP